LKYAFLFGKYRTADYDARDHLAITVQNFSTHRDDGDENGCRIEIQLVHEEMSSLAAAKVTTLEEPVWRADIFSTRTSIGSWDRAHFHPRFEGQEPSGRAYAQEEIRKDPVEWARERLSNLPALLTEGGHPEVLDHIDLVDVESALPAMVAAIAATLYEDGVAAG
jgi:hypothetical protein